VRAPRYLLPSWETPPFNTTAVTTTPPLVAPFVLTLPEYLVWRRAVNVSRVCLAVAVAFVTNYSVDDTPIPNLDVTICRFSFVDSNLDSAAIVSLSFRLIL